MEDEKDERKLRWRALLKSKNKLIELDERKHSKNEKEEGKAKKRK